MRTLDSVFTLLNSSNPATNSCWLCLNPSPPYYVGLAASLKIGTGEGEVKNTTLDDQHLTDLATCLEGGAASLTLGDLQGEGSCFIGGHYSLSASPYFQNCNSSMKISRNTQVLIAPEGVWFACTYGLTRCLVAERSREPWFRILVYVIPQVYIYAGPSGMEHFLSPEAHLRLQKRTPLLVPLLAGLGIAGSAAVSAAALTTGQIGIQKLSVQFSEDIRLIQDQISHLEKALDSLAEVVLQNRRGLDLLFLQQGGLCAALGEACCFYANHSGVIRESIKTLQKRLKEREKEKESQEGWFEGLFNWSPWLTTLISALAGPLLLLLLGLICGPIIINRLVAFVRERVQAVKLLALTTQYSRIMQAEDTAV